MSDNVRPLVPREKKQGIRMVVSAFFKPDPNGATITYPAELWIRKDVVLEVLKTHPTNAYCCVVTTKTNKVYECHESYESVLKQLEE